MITSAANPQVKRLVRLKKSAGERRRQELYVVEGARMCAEAPAEMVERVYVSASLAKEGVGAGLPAGREFEVLADSVFARVSDVRAPQGMLCLVRMQTPDPDLSIFHGSGAIYLILENVQDPGNLGSMFRTGEGAGIAGVVMDSSTADIYNPKTVRSTMGSIFRVPFHISDDLHETIRVFKSRGIRIFATGPAGGVSYDEPDYKKGAAFLIGNEGGGLAADTEALADGRISIPMRGRLESLNVAMAAGVLMYEADRQRRQ